MYFLQPSEVTGAAFDDFLLGAPGAIVSRKLFLEKYLCAKTSGLKCEVKKENNHFDFKIEKPLCYPVSGKVTYQDGTPVKGGTIVFQHDDTVTIGAINPADGRYKLTTIEPGDGAEPGRYAVYFQQPTERVGARGLPEPPRVPEHNVVEHKVFQDKYLSPKTSGLSCEVKAKSNQFDFKVAKP